MHCITIASVATKSNEAVVEQAASAVVVLVVVSGANVVRVGVVGRTVVGTVVVCGTVVGTDVVCGLSVIVVDVAEEVNSVVVLNAGSIVYGMWCKNIYNIVYFNSILQLLPDLYLSCLLYIRYRKDITVIFNACLYTLRPTLLGKSIFLQ